MIQYRKTEEIEKAAASGRILSSVMAAIIPGVKEGVALIDLDHLAETLIKKAGAKAAFLDYRPDGAKHPYGASICTSLNDVVVHGLPTNYKLRSGDVLKLDFGVLYNGFYTDAAKTFGIGKISNEAQLLIQATKDCLAQALKQAQTGKTLGDIGYAVEKTAKKYGFNVISGLTGHGIGRDLHEDPVVYNYGEKGKGIKLKPGMILAIEPMLSAGSLEIIQKKDESWATKDGSLSAHFEHTVAITEGGVRILTI